MPVTLSPTHLTTIIAAAITDYASPPGYYVTNCALFAGTQPANPTITSGITQLHSALVSLPGGTWFPPSNGVSALASPIGITANTTGTASFLRLYGDSAGIPLFDVPVGLPGSGSPAIMPSLNATSGASLQVSDLRFHVAASGALCFSPNVSNNIVGQISANQATWTGGAAFSKYNIDSGLYDRTVTLEAWDGPIPTDPYATPTGTKLWTKALAGDNLFAVSGMGMSLLSNQTANAIASGTPTFVRATKAAYSTYPQSVLQAPIGGPTNGVMFSAETFTSGASVTMTNFTVIFAP